MEITTAELKLIFNKVLDKLEFDNIKKIDIDFDFYRYVPTDNWRSFDENEIILGSLSDDLISLKHLLMNNEVPCTYVDFDRLASVLRAISEILNPVDDFDKTGKT